MARLDLRAVRRPDLQPSFESGIGEGSWVGNRIALRIGVGEANGILILRYRGSKLTVEQVLRLTPEVARDVGLEGARFMGFGPPVFVDRSGREFSAQLTVLQHDERGVVVYLTCDRAELHCRRGRMLEPRTKWATLVYNPSRPLPSS